MLDKGDNVGSPSSMYNYSLDIARGNISGSSPFQAHGSLTTSGSAINQLLWPNGIFRIPSSSGVSIDLVSSNSNDTLLGSGVRRVRIMYLDIDLNPNYIDVDLNGTTPVIDVILDCRFIQCVYVIDTGTPYQGATGNIRAYNLTQDYAVISIGKVHSESTARMVPATKRGVIYGMIGSSISGTSAARANIELAATEINGVQSTDQGLFHPYGSVGLQDGSETYNLPVPQIFTGGTVIAMFIGVDKGALLTGGWFGWLENSNV